MGQQRNTYLGQSLVEMAIITPIIIFFLLGIFEVGYALRNYLTLVNVNREGVRYAVRPNYLDLSKENPAYEDVYNRILITSEGQLDKNAIQVIINVVSIDTGWPCDPEKRESPKYFKKDNENSDWYEVKEIKDSTNEWPKFYTDQWPNCDCDLVKTEPYTPYIIINSVTNPKYKWEKITDFQSKINIEELSYSLAVKNDSNNCESVKKHPAILPSQEDLVIIELFYDSPQLFGFPIISNPLTDPIPMYTHTVMRKNPQRKSPFSNGY